LPLVASATTPDAPTAEAPTDASLAALEAPAAPKPGLEPPFLRGLCYGLAASTACWGIVAAVVLLLR
jgi:hypothetical protein